MPKKKEKKVLFPEDQLKALESKQNAKRGHYAHYNLYPDNPVMMRFFEWLTGHKYIGKGAYTITGTAHMASGCWILHEPEKDEKKEHIHVLCYFEQAHSQKAYAKLGGKTEYQIQDGNYIYDKDLFNANIDAVVDDLLKPKVHAQVVEDPPTMLLYLTHETFAAQEDGKKRYDRTALHWFGANYNKIMDFYRDAECNNHSIELDLLRLSGKCTNISELMNLLLSNGMIKHVEFIRKNSYFCKIFLFGGLK